MDNYRFRQELSNQGWRVEWRGSTIGHVRKYWTEGRITERWEALRNGNVLAQGFVSRKKAAIYLASPQSA